jgi:hypothetical protein
MALSRLSQLHMCGPQPLSGLSASELPMATESVRGLVLPGGTTSAVSSVLDNIDIQISEALQQGPETQIRVLQSSCVALGSFRDLLAAVTNQNGNDARSQLRSILFTVAKHASGLLGLQKPNGAVAQQPGSQWGWDCTVKGAVSSLQVSRAGDASQAAMLLCEQLSKTLALCSVARRFAFFNLELLSLGIRDTACA